MNIRGIARVGSKTKNLCRRLRPGEIAVINHPDLDEVAARSLIEARVKAVVNAAPSQTGRYPNPGPSLLLSAHIPILDNVGESIMNLLPDGEPISLVEETVLHRNRPIARGRLLILSEVEKQMEASRCRLDDELDTFIQNTLDYARREKGLVLGAYPVPPLRTELHGRHVLIVVRGKDYKADLATLRSYIDEVKPVLIGVDGGADALREVGLIPHIIIGDMDSVSDRTLRAGSELIVHAYPNGRAPGLQRIKDLGLSAVVFPTPGTSEDAAMLMAYEKGARLIVAVGTHSNMVDFLEKGRKGMASTFLVRLKVGSILVDAKGVAQLYRGNARFTHLAGVLIAGLLPVVVLCALSPAVFYFFRLAFLKFCLMLGF